MPDIGTAPRPRPRFDTGTKLQFRGIFFAYIISSADGGRGRI